MPYRIGFTNHSFNFNHFCIMAKSKISAPVGFFNAKCKPENQAQPLTKTAPKKNIWCQYEKQETPTVWQSRGFSLELIPTGKFITVEFINKRGEVSRYNGRTGVKKYLAGRGAAETIARDNVTSDYFILWVRRAGVKFDSVAMIHKRRIVKLSAGGVLLWQNKTSHYAKTV